MLALLSIFIHNTPTHIHINQFQYRNGNASSAVKHLYIGRMTGLKTEEDIRELECKLDPPEIEFVWLDDPTIKDWVLQSFQQQNVAIKRE